MTSELLSRVANAALKAKIVSPHDAAEIGSACLRKESIWRAQRTTGRHSVDLQTTLPRLQPILHEEGVITVGFSGFAGTGEPKLMPGMLASLPNAAETIPRMRLISGASLSDEVESPFAKLGLISRRHPFVSSKETLEKINRCGKTMFSDHHLGRFPRDLKRGFFSQNPKTHETELPAVALLFVEATEILEDGSIVLSAGVGATPELIDMASHIIIEVNTSLPTAWLGFHDIPHHHQPAHTFLISDPLQRSGNTHIKVDPSKVIAVVESKHEDKSIHFKPGQAAETQIANHLMEFFAHEVKFGRLPKNLHPIQSGVGQIANEVLESLGKATHGSHGIELDHLSIWTEVLQDSVLALHEAGKLKAASACALTLSPEAFKRFYSNGTMESLRKKMVLRPQSVSNSAGNISALNVISMNTPIEIDIYGHANSSCVAGSRLMHGIGGSGDFLRNAGLSILHCPSTRPTSADLHGISSIVPFASHIDHVEHDLHVVVTEIGLADLRGLAPRERAREIIDKCAHPLYKPLLTDYLVTAERHCVFMNGHYGSYSNPQAFSAHEPHFLSKAFFLHESLEKTGSMRDAVDPLFS